MNKLANAGRRVVSTLPTVLVLMGGPFASASQAQVVPSASNVSSSTGKIADQVSTAGDKVSPDSAQLGDIVVTARRRDENLLKVPIAISVMSEAKIAQTGVKDLRDLSLFTPGLSAQTTSSTGKADRSQVRLTFRGLSTDPGSIFIDGSPYAGNGTPDVTDVQRVEVLNGPQSVYFGRSTFSGAVNFVTKPPANHFGGRVSEELTTYHGTDSRLMLEGPILKDDLLNARVSARRYTFGGQYVSGIEPSDKLGKLSTTSVSVALSSSPSQRLRLSAYYSYILDDDGAPASASVNAVGVGAALNCNLGGTGGLYYCGQLPSLSGINPVGIGEFDRVNPMISNEFFNNARNAQVPFDTNWLNRFGLKREIHHAQFKADYTSEGGWDATAQVAYNRTKLPTCKAQRGGIQAILPTPIIPRHLLPWLQIARHQLPALLNDSATRRQPIRKKHII